jgi:hypothetical protein
MKKISLKWSRMLFAFAVGLLLASCIDGYHDDWTFSSGVSNSKVESPADTAIQIAKNADGTLLEITWPVVYGANGYEVSIYNVDDPANPKVIGTEKSFVDGCQTKCAYLDDTKYKFVIKSLGNTKYNNKDADSATTKLYSTLIPAVQIPDGTDLYTYFTTIAIKDTTTEIAYELVAHGNYTVSGPIDFQKHWLTLRGDKIYHPTVTYTSTGRMMTTSGITVKYINFDCSAITSTTSDGAFLSLSSTPDESIKGTGLYYILRAPKSVMVASCNFKPMTTRFIYDNNKKYCIENLIIKNCIIPLAIIPTDGVIFFKAGFVDNFYFTNNTIYGTVSTAGYFLKYENSGRPDRAGFVAASININKNTFYNVVSTGQMANYPAMNNAAVALKLSKNIFMNCGSNAVVRRFSISAATMVKTFSDNCYWFAGSTAATIEANEFTPTYGDKSGSGYIQDPLFKDPANGDFTVDAAADKVISHTSGDPRWLPVAQ